MPDETRRWTTSTKSLNNILIAQGAGFDPLARSIARWHLDPAKGRETLLREVEERRADPASGELIRRAQRALESPSPHK